MCGGIEVLGAASDRRDDDKGRADAQCHHILSPRLQRQHESVTGFHSTRCRDTSPSPLADVRGARLRHLRHTVLPEGGVGGLRAAAVDVLHDGGVASDVRRASGCGE